MNKKLIAFSFIFLFLMVGMVSAVAKSYDEDTQTVTLKETFLLIPVGDIAEAQLLTPLNNKVGLGYQRVAEFEVSGKKDWNDLFYRDIKTYNKHKYDKGDEIELERQFDWKYKTTKQVLVEEFTSTCIDSINLIGCERIKIGEHYEIKEEWLPFDKSLKIKKDDIYTIGLYTTVQKGDYIEWIPNFAGKKVDEWATWEASLTVDLVAYYNMDETSGDMLDLIGSVDSSTNVGLQGKNGIIETGYQYGTQADNFTSFTSNYGIGLNDNAINLWVYLPSTSMKSGFFHIGDGSSNGFGFGVGSNTYTNNGNHLLGIWQASRYIDTNVAIGTGWHMISLNMYSDGDNEFYIDGVSVYNDTGGNAPISSSSLATIGGIDDTPHLGFGGWEDEVGIWDRDLTQQEITDLYNAGVGLTYPLTPADATPDVTLNSPSNDSTLGNPSVTFNVDVTDDIKVQNVSLYIDGSLDQTNSSNYNGTYIFTKSLTNGEHNWSILAYDNNSASNQSETRTLTITVVPPTIELSVPVDNLKTTTPTNTFYAYVTDNFEVENVSLFIDGSINETNTDGTNATNYTFTKTLGEGSHTWYVQAFDNDSYDSTSSTRTITIDTINPVSSISDPAGSFGTLVNGANMTLKFTANDTNIDSCVWEYNGVNTTFSCATGIEKTDYFDYVLDVDTAKLYVNDTAGNVNWSSTSWAYRFNENSQTFQSSVLEGSVTNIKANISVGATYDISYVQLTYNGTATVGSYYEDGVYTILDYNKTLIQVDADLNTTFYWTVFFTDDVNSNLTIQNQTIVNLGIDNCSVYTNVFYNFTIVDEKAQTFLAPSTQNTTAKVDLTVYTTTGNEVINFSSLYTKVNPYTICLNNNLSAGESYLIDLQTQYGADDYASEYYNLQQDTLDLSDLDTKITLYDLDNTTSQVFKVTYKDSNYLPVEDALVQVQRKYIDEGVFKVVESPITDSSGETLVHLEVADAIYNFIMTKDGVALASFESAGVKCTNELLGDCSLNFNDLTASITTEDFSNADGFSFAILYDNETRLASITFSNTGVALVSLNLTANDGAGTSACSNQVSSNTGTLSCTIPTSIRNETVSIRVYRDNVFQGQGFIDLRQDPADIYGTSSVFLTIFLYLTLIGVGLTDNPLIEGLFIILGAVLGVALNMVDGGGGFIGATATILWLIIAVVLVLIKGSRRA